MVLNEKNTGSNSRNISSNHENYLSHQSSLTQTNVTLIVNDFNGIPKNILDKISLNSQGYYELIPKYYYFGFENLPQGYGYKGGAARLLLELNIEKKTTEIPRDLDIIRFIDEPEQGLDHKLAKKYMPDDFKHGNGVELLEENYFESRDFTINEVLYKEGKLIFTKEALIDMFHNIIRATKSTFNEYYQDHDFSTVIKALRFYVNYKERFGTATLEFLNSNQLESTYINLFWIALNLDKANETSSIQANALLEKLKVLGKLPSNIFTLEEARKFIEDSGEVHNFKFKTIGSYDDMNNVIGDLDDWFNDYVLGNIDLSKFDIMPMRGNKKIR